MTDMYQAQIALEAAALEQGRQRYLAACQTSKGTRKGTKDQPVGHALIRTLVTPVAEALKDSLHNKRGNGRVKAIRQAILGTGLTELEIAYLGVRQLLFLDLVQNKGKGTPLASLGVNLGRAMVAEARLREFHAEHKPYVEATLRNHQLVRGNQHMIIKALDRGKKRVMGETELDQELNSVDAFAMGNEVIRVILAVCSDWFVRTQGRSKHVPTKVVPTAKLMAWLEEKGEAASVLRPVRKPMIVPPRDWSSHRDGGYLTLPTRLILSRSSVHRHRTSVSPEARRAVNAAQQTAWRVNERVYQVACQLYGQGSGLAGLTALVEIPADLPEGADAEAVKARKKEQLHAYQDSIKATSGRTSEILKLNLASEFKSYERFYFPYALDWRGRVYPLATSLNPQGDDLAKGMLQFADGKPLGREGERWLAIHGANCFGHDKLAYSERLKFIDEATERIQLVAEDPFADLWWTEADEPFKFLAFCFEWAAMLEEPYAEAFISHLPVALDGTCSGLQHFSALLRDERGGASVNLVPAAEPADIYSEVAEEVRKAITSDCWQARVWEGLINRTTCKRGTMTVPYGVTRHGLSDQLIDLVKTDEAYAEVFHRAAFERAKVNDRMSDADWEAYEDKPSATRACLWLAERLENAIERVVLASQTGKRFLNDLASCYSQAGQDFRWVTPLGIEITQGYRAPKITRIQTFYGGTRVTVSVTDDAKEAPRNARKGKAGSSPNYIHSLDATHLLWTVLDCVDNAGMKDFALIHDSFGVHAGDIPTLNRSLRSTFVRLYSEPLLERLLEQAKEDLPEDIHGDLPAIPEAGSLRLEVVRLSPYIFM
jgi:DNA-directed RNA polymerase, mitochondrial